MPARRLSPTPASRAPSFLYVLPSAHEDILKLGMSRDPLARMQAFDRRYFEAFDLDRGLLVATETVRDAHALEQALRARLREHNAPAPLLIRREAGGHTEWYRGAYGPLADAARALGEAGHEVHEPLRPWVREALLQRADRLFSWASGALDQATLRPGSGGLERLTRDEQQLMRDALDAYAALQIDLEPWLPAQVLDWYQGQR